MTTDELRSFLRSAILRGIEIEADDPECKYADRGRYSARIDAVARDFADELKPHLKPTEPRQ